MYSYPPEGSVNKRLVVAGCVVLMPVALDFGQSARTALAPKPTAAPAARLQAADVGAHDRHGVTYNEDHK